MNNYGLDSAAEPFQADWNYEATVKKVEEIMTRIEAGELELAEVFDQFAIAVEYLRQCETFLAQRQKQVDLLIETLADEPEF
ncbi:exodeoxyribonuclease VII small subunit [Leptothermofonsia sichuanensis E412]|uniref:exodeoxyribonuclease VII small subunit n=1 Tax=Leptothermofonsia sichuanensis TaxID=2917832 RepID=UPI001CA72FB6|nr:exodeoxyribonuclease VII small subunit [Leptothermofonsia sichuanensis]QZZ21976.1 exodeoxyribonuclease VII small subunit [Leptothermofonsia sichuanensis E412]